ncbi:MAG: type II secretion system inner membrane protein GspF [Desulfobacterales bacterium]
MPVFEYKALNEKGKTMSGIIDADSSFSARQKLRAARIFPVSVNEIERSPRKKSGFFLTLSSVFSRISPMETAACTRQLSTLVGAGFPLVNAIDSLIPQTKSQNLKKKLARIKDDVVEGNSFSGALSRHPETFPPYYVNMVHAGEVSGTLDIVLERLSEMTEQQQALKNRVRSAAAYPVLMSIIGILVMFFLMAYIVPSITSIFDEMGQALPVYTRFLILISGFFQKFWWAALVLAVAGVAICRKLLKNDNVKYAFHKLLLKAPGMGEFIRKISAVRFSIMLGSLLENGVPMLAAMQIVKNTVDNTVISGAIESVAKEVGKGRSLADSLDEARIFPGLCIQMIQVGEDSGELEKMLFKVADVFENEVESRIMTLTSLLEPLLIVVMGIIVGFIVISICLPIFEMNQLIR